NLRVDLPYGHGSGNHGNHDHGEADHAGVVTGLGDGHGGVKDDGGAVGVPGDGIALAVARAEGSPQVGVGHVDFLVLNSLAEIGSAAIVQPLIELHGLGITGITIGNTNNQIISVTSESSNHLI